MIKFKAGDKVKKKNGNVFTNGNMVCTVGIDGIGSTDLSVWIKETNERLYKIDLELAQSSLNKPHKHRDLIIAWANGAEIQILRGFDVWEDSPNPTWSVRCEYRLKPQKTKLTTEIEKIESEMRKLADRLNDLKGM